MNKPKLSSACVKCKEEHHRSWLLDLVKNWGEEGPPQQAIKQGGVLCLPCTLGKLEEVVDNENSTEEQRDVAISILDKMAAIPGIERLGVRKR